jgi:two-component system sensor histidine kinase TctE
VWFGVARGLAPLTDLESAIARRSATDLAPIKRRIPQEVNGIVGRFNDLLGELSRTLDAKDAFISDAAHQLRNPIAGVLSLAESVVNAKSRDDAIARAEDLRDAARDAGQLANNLLTLERARAKPANGQMQAFDPILLLSDTVVKFAKTASDRGVNFTSDLIEHPILLAGDPVMFEQAILNVLNNALNHGGADLTLIHLRAQAFGQTFEVEVTDDGIGIEPKDFERALGRFSQIGPSAGSGLGLPITQAVLESFGGDIQLSRQDRGLSVLMIFPMRASLRPL